ncbi:MAG: hypothetical protein Q8P18_16960 [Pseudomonadota bacterium]|nr:hypothetical protein [Pseudomonadota bacterium]
MHLLSSTPVRVALLLALLLALSAAPAAAGGSSEPSSQERPTLVTETTLDRWQKELSPLIEAASGRRFVERPKLTLASRAFVVERVARLDRSANTLGAAAPVSLVDPGLEHVLGLYLHGTQEVFFLTDTVQAAFDDHGFAPDLLHPVMRCVVAHELVHALQHQVAPLYEDGGAEAMRVALSLREGHADFVAAQVCGSGSRYLDLAQGLDIPASRSPDDPDAFAYGYAETFVGVLQATAGAEAVWAALSAEPPPRALVTRVGSQGLPGGWTDASVVRAVAQGIVPSTGGVSGPVSPAALLAVLAADDDRATDIPAVAGLSHLDEGADSFLGVVAFLLRDETAPAAWLSRRWTALRAGHVRVLGGAGRFTDPPKMGPLKALEKRTPALDATLSLQMKLDGGQRYVEHWAARGRYLFGVIHRSVDADPKVVLSALTRLLAAPLPDVPTAAPLSEEDRAALLSMAPNAPLAAAVSWQYRRDELYPVVLRKDWESCIDAVDAAAPGLDRAGQSALAEHGMVCALNAPDLGAADRYYALVLAPSSLQPEHAVIYAQHLAEARRWEAVLGVLDAVPAPAEEGAASASAAARLQANVNLRRWPEVERLVGVVTRPGAVGAPAMTRAWAASELAQAGRTRSARTALRSACPALTGEERRQCDGLLADLGG